MNWRYKAFMQACFSNLFCGESLNYLMQRFITRTVPGSLDHCAHVAAAAKEHLDAYRRHGDGSIGDAVFFEFGAGWDLLIPLAFSLAGVNRQIVVDIRRLLRIPLVNAALANLRRLPPELGLGRRHGPDLSRSGDPHRVLRDAYGIDYRAPCDARNTSLAAESVDCITSTNTLEHIPPADILAILRECRRLLRPGGVMCHRIDYLDHYSYFDKAIHPYHFLRYSDDKWRWFNSSLHFQNRLRHRDYLSLFRQAGFDVIEDRTADGAAGDLMTLSQFRIDAAFQGYSHAELAIRGAFVVLRKANVLADVPRLPALREPS